MGSQLRSSDPTTVREARSTRYLDARLASVGRKTGGEDFEIPVIDLAPSFSRSMAARQAVANKIHDACTTSGFFYVTNHGISADSCQGILHQANRFFKDLGPAQKEELHVKHGKFGYGWEPSEYTSLAGDRETKEGFNWAYEDSMDGSGGDGQHQNMDGSMGNANMWPREEDLPGFYDGLKDYYGGVLDLSRHLFKLFALSLSLPETYFDPMTTHPGGIARLLYYPVPRVPVSTGSADAGSDGDPAVTIGLGAHTDWECFTVLHTSDTPGLEILSPENTWHAAAHVPGSLIVNIGDFLMRWTNGRYRSTIHRVVNRSNDERFSVPFFFSVNYETLVETLPTCLSEGEEGFAPIRAGEYVLERFREAAAKMV
ncbi:Clavaminate synthase-like protein [Corynespora cassiicola Philippines]|uniref:Clavaminate synthase-like protein n=1 Tax=Corynespora cassiicola Philippines TaxID=1448308 RepID=A0A2T2NK07_CORCC|nr:Clavaminate synthase-like protein [Corynespora cassiicola Philippines]